MLECTFTCNHCHKQWTNVVAFPIQICHCGRIIYGTADREHTGVCDACKGNGELFRKNKGFVMEMVCSKCLFGEER